MGLLEKKLFTPGPLNTSPTVKAAMLRDVGSRDNEFIQIVRQIRQELLRLAGVTQEEGYESILIQGSGTFGVESVLSSALSSEDKLLLLINGAYGERMGQIVERYHIRSENLRWPENQPINPEAVKKALAEDPGLTHVAVVHCETTTGILNPIQSIGEIVQAAGRSYIVDAMSSFGAIPIHLKECAIDYLISSANKCIQGVPGFAFALVARGALEKCKGQARTLSLDLYEQWRGLEQNGQFRFTPPTHAILAFSQALQELQAEGGVEGRAQRYRQNHELLRKGMCHLGFVPYLDEPEQSWIITAFHYPKTSRFHFDEFYQRLNARGFVIYPGKLGKVDCFRLGNIGHLYPTDIEELLKNIESVLEEMNIKLK
jgi:2-aminoethylphosphonate-pyruvate transaminase